MQADAHKITDDPKFVDPGSGGNGMDTVNGYQLQATSPLIGAGIRINDNGGRDYFGNLLYNGAPDIGAHEYEGSVPPAGNMPDPIVIVPKRPASTPVDNLATQAASTTFQTSSSGPIEHIIDNDYDTAWETETKPSFPNDITLDFGEQTLMANQLKLNTRYGKDLGITNFDLEYRNGSAWIPLRTNINLTWDLNTGANEIKSVEFPLTRFSQIRLKVHDGVNQRGESH